MSFYLNSTDQGEIGILVYKGISSNGMETCLWWKAPAVIIAAVDELNFCSAGCGKCSSQGAPCRRELGSNKNHAPSPPNFDLQLSNFDVLDAAFPAFYPTRKPGISCCISPSQCDRPLRRCPKPRRRSMRRFWWKIFWTSKVKKKIPNLRQNDLHISKRKRTLGLRPYMMSSWSSGS